VPGILTRTGEITLSAHFFAAPAIASHPNVAKKAPFEWGTPCRPSSPRMLRYTVGHIIVVAHKNNRGAPSKPVLLGWGRSTSRAQERNSIPLSASRGPVGFDLNDTRLTRQIMSKAAPGPILRALDQAASDRIAVDVAQLLDTLLLGPDIEIVVALLPEVLLSTDEPSSEEEQNRRQTERSPVFSQSGDECQPGLPRIGCGILRRSTLANGVVLVFDFLCSGWSHSGRFCSGGVVTAMPRSRTRVSHGR